MNPLLTALPLLFLGIADPAETADRHVVVISIDGLPGYLLDDPQASLPVIRRLIADGAVAEAGMGVSNPSVTWPNHTTLMSGVHPERHGVLFNGLPERQGVGMPVKVTGEKTQQELVRVPLLFDALKSAGLASAAINWPCTSESAAIADNFPDVPNDLDHTTARLKSELDEIGLLKRFKGGSAVVRDEAWTESACRIIRDRKPALLALHLLNLDGTHHRHGPKTPPGYTAAALTDALVGRVLRAIDDAGIRETTTVFIVSDHGFMTAPKSIRPNVLLRKAGLLTVGESGRVATARAHVIPEGGIGMLYLTDPEKAGADRETVRRLFADQEGVAAVLGPEDYPRLRLPSPTEHLGMADLIVACKEGYSVGASAAGDDFVVAQDGSVGVHGYLSTEPQIRATFVASGAGVKRGLKLGTVDNSDVAPTVARILGVPFPQATGRVLEDMLATQERAR